MSNCKHLTRRSYKNKKYFYCREQKQEIELSDCNDCEFKEYKEVKPIKSKSNRLQSAENRRESIFTHNGNKCYICNKNIATDCHEMIGGRNRLTSIKWNLVVYLCRKCHSELDLDQSKKEKLQIIAQNKFIELYGYDKFIVEFGMDYIEKIKNRREREENS